MARIHPIYKGQGPLRIHLELSGMVQAGYHVSLTAPNTSEPYFEAHGHTADDPKPLLKVPGKIDQHHGSVLMVTAMVAAVSQGLTTPHALRYAVRQKRSIAEWVEVQGEAYSEPVPYDLFAVLKLAES